MGQIPRLSMPILNASVATRIAVCTLRVARETECLDDDGFIPFREHWENTG